MPPQEKNAQTEQGQQQGARTQYVHMCTLAFTIHLCGMQHISLYVYAWSKPVVASFGSSTVGKTKALR